MEERRLQKLKRRELLQMLLVQCEETERLQQEAKEIKEQFEEMSDSYGRLKRKLDIKDERLNQKDAAISKLRGEIEEMKAARRAELERAGTVTEASVCLNELFKDAQTAAEQYLNSVRKLREKMQGKPTVKIHPMPQPRANTPCTGRTAIAAGGKHGR